MDGAEGTGAKMIDETSSEVFFFSWMDFETFSATSLLAKARSWGSGRGVGKTIPGESSRSDGFRVAIRSCWTSGNPWKLGEASAIGGRSEVGKVGGSLFEGGVS